MDHSMFLTLVIGPLDLQYVCVCLLVLVNSLVAERSDPEFLQTLKSHKVERRCEQASTQVVVRPEGRLWSAGSQVGLHGSSIDWVRPAPRPAGDLCLDSWNTGNPLRAATPDWRSCGGSPL